MKIAVCAVIENDDGLFLAVSRKDNPNDFGFPGGHVEEGELPIEAVVREVFEETGVRVFRPHILMTAVNEDFLVYAYQFEHYFLPTILKGKTPAETGVVKWVKPEVVCNGSFGVYNRLVMTTLDYLDWQLGSLSSSRRFPGI
jgi:8-oxo-dGTP diphosphatase